MTSLVDVGAHCMHKSSMPVADVRGQRTCSCCCLKTGVLELTRRQYSHPVKRRIEGGSWLGLVALRRSSGLAWKL